MTCSEIRGRMFTATPTASRCAGSLIVAEARSRRSQRTASPQSTPVPRGASTRRRGRQADSAPDPGAIHLNEEHRPARVAGPGPRA
jgi:hypothetical protein